MTACVPAGGEGKTGRPAPLVVALHGFTQAAQAYEDTTEWNVLAGRYGFYVIFPATPGSRSWTWFSADRARGKGDEAGIVSMVDAMKSTHDILADMVFVTGLSAGGFETTVLLADYPDVFAAGASFAGGPYGCDMGCMSNGTGHGADAVKAAFPAWWNDASKRKPRLLAVQGDNDNVVAPNNLAAMVTQWSDAVGAGTKLPAAQLKGYPYEVHSRDGTSIDVASVSVTGMSHATPVDPGTGVDQGGKTGSYAAAVKLYGPYYAAKFFGLVP